MATSITQQVIETTHQWGLSAYETGSEWMGKSVRLVSASACTIRVPATVAAAAASTQAVALAILAHPWTLPICAAVALGGLTFVCLKLYRDPESTKLQAEQQRDTIKNLQDRAAQSEQEVARLNRTMNEPAPSSLSAEESIRSAIEQVDRIEATVTGLLEEKQNLEQRTLHQEQTISALQSDNLRLKSAKDQIATDLQELKSGVAAAIEAHHKKAEQVSAVIAELNRKLTDAESEREALIRENTEMKQAHETKLDEIRATKEKACTEKEEAQQGVLLLQQEVTNQASTIQQLEERLATVLHFNGKLSDVQKQLRSASTKIQKRDTELAKTRQRVLDLESQLEKLQAASLTKPERMGWKVLSKAASR